MKKLIYALVLPLLAVSGLLWASRDSKVEKLTPSTSKSLPAAEKNATLKRWEASPDGVYFKKWKESPDGQRVLAAAAKLRPHTTTSADMLAEVTSLSLPPGSRLGFGVMVRIDGLDYILNFGPEKPSVLEPLHRLHVGDKITVRSHFVSYAPKYAYAIVTGDFVERNGEELYKATPRKDGC